MKLKTDANALLTAAAFGTATFMMMMLNQNGEEVAVSMDSAEANAVYDRIRKSIPDEVSEQDNNDCSYLRFDDEPCEDDSEDLDDVTQYSEEAQGPRKRSKKLFTYSSWQEDNASSYSKKFAEIVKNNKKAYQKKRSLRNEPITFELAGAFEPPIIQSGSPWFDGDFDYANQICGNAIEMDMKDTFLRSFSIFYPQTIMFDADADQMALWNAYKQFNYAVTTNVGLATRKLTTMALTGYRGTQIQRPFSFRAKDVQDKGARAWENELDRSYGPLKDAGFTVPARRNKANTMINSQPKFKVFADYIKRWNQNKKVLDMVDNEEACVNVIILHDVLSDAGTIDNWTATGRTKNQITNNENLAKCVQIPIMIAPEGAEHFQKSTVTGFNPSTLKYDQLHEDKNEYFVVTPSEFIDNVQDIADQVAQWTCAINNRFQCAHTADPFSFEAPQDDFRAATTEGTTTEGTTTTEWTSTEATTTTTEATTTTEFTTTTATTTEGQALRNYCCFGTIDSPYGTVDSCENKSIPTSGYE